MEIKEKIKEINKLNETIDSLVAFLELLQKSNIDSEYGDKKYPKRKEFIMDVRK